MKIYIGIDPGQTGAVAILGGKDSNELAVFDYDDPVGLSTLQNCAMSGGAFAMLEKVGSFPGQGVSSTFKFGANFGEWQGIIKALQIPFELITPQKWQKSIFDSMPKGDRKTMSLDLARRLFPGADLRLKKHHGRADALLIAEYLRRREEGRL